MNQTMLVGRLTREVEIKTVGVHRVVNNCLAVSRKHRDRNGEVKTDFIPLVAWDHWADLLHKYTQKGHRVGICGRMESRSYTNAQNQVVYLLECQVQDVTLLESKAHKTTETMQNSAEIRRQFEVPNETFTDM